MKSLFFILAFCMGTQALFAQAKSVIGQFGDVKLRQLVTPGFDELAPERKVYFYYLAQAMKVSDEIYWRQYSRHGLAIRDLLLDILEFEDLFAVLKDFELKDFEANEEKRYWTNADKIANRFPIEQIKLYLLELSTFRGNYDYIKNSKILPKDWNSLDLLRLIDFAQKSLRLPKDKAQQMRQEVRRLRKAIFSADYFPKYKDVKDGDRLLGSPSSFYAPGITEEEAKNFSKSILTYLERNTRGEVVETKHSITSGPFKDYLALIDYYLEQASSYANETEKNLIRLHRKVLRTGDVEDYKAYEIEWVQYNSKDIDYRLDFVEQYLDPLGHKAYHEGMLTLKKIDPETVRQQEAIRNIIYKLEEKMPVEERFKKKGEFIIPSAETVNLAFSGGAAGAKPMGGYNLSNFKDVTQKVGSKSHSLSNVGLDIGSNETPEQAQKRAKSFFSSKHAKDVEAYSIEKTYPLHVNFHEVAGHGSGEILEGDPRVDLGSLFNPIEELRAETAAVYHVLDVDFLYESKIFPPEMSLEDARSFSRAAAVNFFTKQLKYWGTISDKTSISQAHRMANQVQMNYMLEKGIIEIHRNKFSETVEINGEKQLRDFELPVVHIKDFQRLREALGEIWFEVQKIVSLSLESEAGDFLNRWSYYNDEQRSYGMSLKQYAEAKKQATKLHFLRPEVVLSQDGKSAKLVYHDGKNGVDQGIAIVKSYREFTKTGISKIAKACSRSANVRTN